MDSALRTPHFALVSLLRIQNLPSQRLAVVADLVQSLTVGNGEVENGRTYLPRPPEECGLADPDLPPVPGKPDGLDLSAREDRADFYGFINLYRHDDQYSEHLFTCQGAGITRAEQHALSFGDN